MPDTRTDTRNALEKIARKYEPLKAGARNPEEWQLWEDFQRDAEAQVIQAAIATHLFES